MNKKFYKSKAFYGALLVVAGAVVEVSGYPELAKLILAVGGALGIVGIRDAKGRLVWK